VPDNQITVGPYRVVFPPTALYQDLRLLQGIENLPVEQLVPKLAVEALFVTVLPWTARFNVELFAPYSS